MAFPAEVCARPGTPRSARLRGLDEGIPALILLSGFGAQARQPCGGADRELAVGDGAELSRPERASEFFKSRFCDCEDAGGNRLAGPIADDLSFLHGAGLPVDPRGGGIPVRAPESRGQLADIRPGDAGMDQAVGSGCWRG